MWVWICIFNMHNIGIYCICMICIKSFRIYIVYYIHTYYICITYTPYMSLYIKSGGQAARWSAHAFYQPACTSGLVQSRMNSRPSFAQAAKRRLDTIYCNTVSVVQMKSGVKDRGALATQWGTQLAPLGAGPGVEGIPGGGGVERWEWAWGGGAGEGIGERKMQRSWLFSTQDYTVLPQMVIRSESASFSYTLDPPPTTL